MTQFYRLQSAEDPTVENVNGEPHDREREATARRVASALDGSNMVERGSGSPLSDAELLEENEPYFEYIEAVSGRKLTEHDRAAFIAFARSKKVQLDEGSRLGIVTLPGRNPHASKE